MPRRKQVDRPGPSKPGRPARGSNRPTAGASAAPRRRAKPISKRPTAKTGAASDQPGRLQKVLAAAGLGSRRECEELILAGRVEVDRQVVTELGTRADPGAQQIRVDGVPLARPRKVCYAVNKPTGVVCTSRDPAGRTRVIDLLPPWHERVFTVGRLDLSSEGLILVTNDGDLANRLTHPRYGVEKTYHVLAAGEVTPAALAQLTKGVHLAEGMARVTRLKVISRKGRSTLLEMVLSEGLNREIRRLLARVGHKVLRLKRVGIGGLRLGDLKPGGFRQLKKEELQRLEAAPHSATTRRTTKKATSRPNRSSGAGSTRS